MALNKSDIKIIQEIIAGDRKKSKADFRKIAKEMHDGFVAITEGVRDDIRVFGERQDDFERKIDQIQSDVSESKAEVKFIKRYLRDNLDPRVVAVESRYSN